MESLIVYTIVVALMVALAATIPRRQGWRQEFKRKQRERKRGELLFGQTPLGEFTRYKREPYWNGSVVFEGEDIDLYITDLYGEPNPLFLARLPGIVCELPELVEIVRMKAPALTELTLLSICEEHEYEISEEEDWRIFHEEREAHKNEDGFYLYFAYGDGDYSIVYFKGRALIAYFVSGWRG
jgi:hypothetical protein